MTDRHLNRRDVLTGAAAAAVGVGGIASATPVAAQSSGDLGEWLSDVGNADGVVDRTGQSEVTVEVGVEANGGGFGFGPAVVRVDPGTTIVWKWTGKGGSHNVVAADGGFESSLTSEAGTTFERTVESSGVVRYFCSPHKMVGMKGAIVVGDVEVTVPGAAATAGGDSTASDSAGDANGGGDGAGGAAGASDGGGGGGGGGLGDGALLIAGGIIGAFVSPVLFGLLLVATDDEDGQQPGAEPAVADTVADGRHVADDDRRERRLDTPNEAD